MSFLIGPGEGRQLGGKFDVVIRVRAEHSGGIMAGPTIFGGSRQDHLGLQSPSVGGT